MILPLAGGLHMLRGHSKPPPLPLRASLAVPTLEQIDDEWEAPLAVSDDEFEIVETVDEIVPFPFSWPIPTGPIDEPSPARKSGVTWTLLRTVLFFGQAVARGACGALLSLATRAVDYLRME